MFTEGIAEYLWEVHVSSLSPRKINTRKGIALIERSVNRQMTAVENEPMVIREIRGLNMVSIFIAPASVSSAEHFAELFKSIAQWLRSQDNRNLLAMHTAPSIE